MPLPSAPALNLPNPYQSWASWLKSPSGQALLAIERRWLEQRLVDQFGYHALQVGPWEINALASNRMLCKARISFFAPQPSDSDEEDQQLVCHPDALPVESESVDLVVLVHCLELVSDPHRLLREAERVLIPEGRLVVLGFNPYSLWALHKPLATRYFPPAENPWLSLGRLKDWCRVLGMTPDGGSAALYRPILSKPRWWDRLAWLEAAGNRWWPGLGAIYLLSAVKRREGMRMMKTNWRQRRASASSQVVVGSSVRTSE